MLSNSKSVTLWWWGALGKNYEHFREKSSSLSLVVAWFWPSCELFIFLHHAMQHFVRKSCTCCGWAAPGETPERGCRGAQSQHPEQCPLVGAQAGWPCPLTSSGLEPHLCSDAASPGTGVLPLPQPHVSFQRRNGFNSWFDDLAGEHQPCEGPLPTWCRSDPKEKQGAVSQKDSNKTC